MIKEIGLRYSFCESEAGAGDFTSKVDQKPKKEVG
jgi:hypothetical protein